MLLFYFKQQRSVVVASLDPAVKYFMAVTTTQARLV